MLGTTFVRHNRIPNLSYALQNRSRTAPDRDIFLAPTDEVSAAPLKSSRAALRKLRGPFDFAVTSKRSSRD